MEMRPSKSVEKTAIMTSSLSMIIKKSKGVIPSIYTKGIKNYIQSRRTENEVTIVSKAKKFRNSKTPVKKISKISPMKIKKFKSLVIDNPTLGGKSLMKLNKSPKFIKRNTRSLPRIQKVKLKVKKLEMGAQKNLKKKMKEGVKISKKEMKNLLDVFNSDGFIDTNNQKLKGERRKGSLSCKIELKPVKPRHTVSFRENKTHLIKNKKNFGMFLTHREKKSGFVKNLRDGIMMTKLVFKKKKEKTPKRKRVLGKARSLIQKKKRKKLKSNANLRVYRKKYPKKRNTENDEEKDDSGFITFHRGIKNNQSKLFFCKKLKLEKSFKKMKKNNRRKKLSQKFIRVGNQGFRFFNVNNQNEGKSDFQNFDFNVKGNKISEWDRFGLATGYSQSLFGNFNPGEKSELEFQV